MRPIFSTLSEKHDVTMPYPRTIIILNWLHWKKKYFNIMLCDRLRNRLQSTYLRKSIEKLNEKITSCERTLTHLIITVLFVEDPNVLYIRISKNEIYEKMLRLKCCRLLLATCRLWNVDGYQLKHFTIDVVTFLFELRDK